MDLSSLNEQQKKAVMTKGPLLVLAGAGSGKTKVLTTRIAYLIKEKKVLNKFILAITFTNKAALEMKERIYSMLGKSAFDIHISTFHSFGLSIIKKNYKLLGFKNNITIIDSHDSLVLIKKIMKDLNVDINYYNPRSIKNYISNNKNELLKPEDCEKYVYTEFDKISLKIYYIYEDKLKSSNSMDFDDLLLLPIELFKKHPLVLKEYQKRFQYILIDEYQDTNQAQYKLIKIIWTPKTDLCVVGDESQSIYSFRGANFKNILNFEKDYKNAQTILLEKNYRSTQTILNVANDIIKNNTEKKEKNLWTSNSIGNKVIYKELQNDFEEANYVVLEIKRLIKEGVNKNEIAILYRTNAQSRKIEEAILKENIPYKVVGSVYFYNRKEIKDLIAYLKLIYNKADDLSLLRIINEPRRGIGAKTIENLHNKAVEENKSLYDAITEKKELEFKKIIEELTLKSERLTLVELVDLVLDKSGLRKSLQNKGVAEEIRLENLEEFKSIAKEFQERQGILSLEDFLYEISLVTDIAEYKDNELLTLMTIHSAKGLEFDYVFIVGMEEELFPHRNSYDNIEEERRLCYVAVTRARKRLWLVGAKRRMIFGDVLNALPSRFIDEINKDYLDISFSKKQFYNFNEEKDVLEIDYKVGDKIIHELFGQGTVINVEGSILSVLFNTKVKKLMKGHKMIRKE